MSSFVKSKGGSRSILRFSLLHILSFSLIAIDYMVTVSCPAKIKQSQLIKTLWFLTWVEMEFASVLLKMLYR